MAIRSIASAILFVPIVVINFAKNSTSLRSLTSFKALLSAQRARSVSISSPVVRPAPVPAFALACDRKCMMRAPG